MYSQDSKISRPKQATRSGCCLGGWVGPEAAVLLPHLGHLVRGLTLPCLVRHHLLGEAFPPPPRLAKLSLLNAPLHKLCWLSELTLWCVGLHESLEGMNNVCPCVWCEAPCLPQQSPSSVKLMHLSWPEQGLGPCGNCFNHFYEYFRERLISWGIN